MTVDLSQFNEAYGAREGLPQGLYYADIEKVEVKETQNGHINVYINGVVSEGPHKATSVSISIMARHKDKGIITMNMQKLGDIHVVCGGDAKEKDFPTVFANIQNSLVGKNVEINVEKTGDNGQYTNYTIIKVNGPATAKPTNPNDAATDADGKPLPF